MAITQEQNIEETKPKTISGAQVFSRAPTSADVRGLSAQDRRNAAQEFQKTGSFTLRKKSPIDEAVEDAQKGEEEKAQEDAAAITDETFAPTKTAQEIANEKARSLGFEEEFLSPEEKAQALIQRQGAETAFQKGQAELTEKVLRSEFTQAKTEAAGRESAAKAALTPSRGGAAVSGARAALPGAIKTGQDIIIGRARDRLQSSINQIAFREQELKDLQKKERKNFTLSDIERESRIKESLANAQTEQLKAQKELAEQSTKANAETIDILDKLGVGLASASIDDLQGILDGNVAAGGDLDLGLALLFQGKATAQKDLDDAKSEEDRAKAMATILNIESQIADRATTKAEKEINFFDELLAAGKITKTQHAESIEEALSIRDKDEVTGNDTGVGAPGGSAGGLRTDRNLNPIAVSLAIKNGTIDLKDKFNKEWTKALDGAGVQWGIEEGANFSNGRRATVKFPSLEESIKGSIVLLGETSAFTHYKSKNYGGRAALEGVETAAQFEALPTQTQLEIIKDLYRFEGGRDGELFQEAESAGIKTVDDAVSKFQERIDAEDSDPDLAEMQQIAKNLEGGGMSKEDIAEFFNQLDDNDMAEFDYDPETGKVTEQGFFRGNL